MNKLTALKLKLALYFSRRRALTAKRMLVNEILSIQVISAAFIGALAVASLYWGGQWVLQDSYSRWAVQWTEELNELGSPLYLADDGEALLRLESFVDRYPETGHAFLNRTREEAYRPEASSAAWKRVIPFLHTELA